MTNADATLSITGRLLNGNDVDTYDLSMIAGHEYDIYVAGSGNGNNQYVPDPRVEGGFSGGSYFDYDDGAGLDANLEFGTNYKNLTGQVFVRASGGGSGLYDLKIVDTSFQTDLSDHLGNAAPLLNVGDKLVSTIETASDGDFIKVHLEANATYVFEARGSGTGEGTLDDPALHLYSGDGSLSLFNDDGGANKNAQIVYTPSQAGDFWLRVDGFSDHVGTYTLQVAGPGVADVPQANLSLFNLPLGGHIEGDIGFADDKDSYRVHLVAGATYKIDLVSAGGAGLPDPYLSLLEANGTVVASDDDSGPGKASEIIYKASESGTFFVQAQDLVVGSGAYDLSIEVQSAPAAPPLTLVSKQDAAHGELMIGTLAADKLTGGAGGDTILGSSGDDTITGGAGKDLLTGGGGLDKFIFNAPSETGTAFAQRDVINTFAHGDKVDLTTIDANTKVAGNQAFTFVDHFTHVAGQLQWDQTAPTGYLIQGDTNGDGATDFSLQIYAAPNFGTIHNWDFIL